MDESPAWPPAAAIADPADTARPAAASRAARRSLWRELSRIGIAALAGAFAGWIFDRALLGYALALTLYVAVHLRHLWALRRWLEAPRHVELTEPGGLWGEVFEKLQYMQKRNRQRKKKLQAIVAEFQASTEALPDGAVVLGERGEIAWFNKAAQAMLGLRGQPDVGIRIANLVRSPDFAEYFEDDDFLGEVEVVSPINRDARLALRVIPYGNNQRLMIVRDVSELRRLDIARRDFVSNASHELRTPLTVLRGYLDMIEPEARGDGPLSAWRMPLAEMRAQAVRMELLVNDMLKLAKLESDADARQDLLDVPAVLARVLDEARAMSQGAHRIDASIEPQLFLYGREVEAQSIFSNLVGNAIRYTPSGGLIAVRWYGDEQGAHLAVADSGIGIAEEDIPRLTERFYRVDVGRSRASGGTGLGLSIVKHALQRHEGRLEIQSELGKGSTFTCHFPPHRVHRAAASQDRRALAG